VDARLYLIVTPALCRGDVVETVRAAVRGGVDLVQLRDKDATDCEFLRLARTLAEFPLILNDRVHLVHEAGALGAHVGEDDMTPKEARAELGPGKLLGVSTHNREELEALEDVDYAGLGPMFTTNTKQLTRTPGGPDLVRHTIDATTLPIFPIGGIHAGNAPALIAAGAMRLAVSSAICAAEDPERAAAALRGLLP